MSIQITDLDKKILNILQEDFPVSTRPYKSIAQKLDITEDELLQRTAMMKENGIIRRIGGVINSRKMGYYSTLCACRVPENKIEQVALIINKEKGVTHNYVRDNYYNLWFTLTAPSYDDAVQIIKNIQSAAGVKIISMPAKNIYKLKVTFEMGDKSDI